jgi:hypothetical protein
MKKLFGAAMLVLVLPIAAGAQGNPDLAGTWTLDMAKSDQAPTATAGRGGTAAAARGAASSSATLAPPARLMISPAADAVSIAQGAQTVTFKLDGTETFWFQGGENRGTAAWNGGKLEVSWRREFYAGPRQGYVTYSGKDVYGVTGNVLSLEKTTAGPNGTETKNYVYNKS